MRAKQTDRQTASHTDESKQTDRQTDRGYTLCIIRWKRDKAPM